MIHFTALLAVFAVASPVAFSHPLLRRQTSDDAILQNGLEAQKLNAAFTTLNATDTCTDGDVACVEGALALCRGDNWVTQNCPATLQCFALPDVNDNGVTIGCTSPNTALSLIEATGAVGGIDGSDNTTSVDDGLSGSVTTVTVTVTLPADGETQTLSPSTATLTPDQAGSIISDASTPTDTPDTPAVGTTILLSGPTPAADPAATPAPTDAGVQGGLASPAPSGTTIILNAAAPVPTPDAAAPSPDAAAATPAAAAPPAAGGGYY